MELSRRRVIAMAVMAAFPVAARADDGPQTLRAKMRQVPLLGPDAPPTEVWSFDSGVIVARQGAELKLRIVNELTEDLWLHFFGVRGPSDLMTLNVAVGETADCVFTPPDAGTFWLAPMADQSRLRDMGLGAMLIVAEAALIDELTDLPVILDDWKVDEQGVIDAEFGDMGLAVGEGRLGNWFTLNARFRPPLALARGKYTRLRLLNAANARDMNLQFKGADPMLIALDGQPLKPRLLGQQSFALAPGQRADFIMLASDGDTRLAVDLFEDTVEIGTLTGNSAPLPELAENFTLPQNPIATALELEAALTFPLLIEGGEKGGMTGALYRGEKKDLRGLLEAGQAWAFNGWAGAGGPPLATLAPMTTAVISVDNRTAFAQPIHIHGHVWREIERDGVALADEPFRDTAVIGPRRTAKLAFVADNPGTWAIQSLIAERADSGLTAAFVVA